MSDDEREKEIEANAPSSSSSNLTLQETMEFEPLTGPQSHSKANSLARVRTSLRSASRDRSNNGYGHDPHASDEPGGIEVEAQSEKDPFEVQWEGGDSDPMNPRSMAHGRKWAVVLIVSASSICV